MAKEAFAGDKKVGTSVLMGAENAFKEWAVPKIPKWLETYHLTMMTVLWSAGNIAAGYAAWKTGNLHWLWFVSLMIILQYVTDLFDGAVGRMRNTGLIKWGFYMDHFLDYVFLASLVAGGALIAPGISLWWYLVLMSLLGCFMVNSFLSFAATNKFEIYHYGFGPTELRLVFIAVNSVVIFTGVEHFRYSVPATCAFLGVVLVVLVFNTQRRLWKIDMDAKAAAEGELRREDAPES